MSKIDCQEHASTSVNLDLIPDVAKKNPTNAILMLVAYLKIKEKENKE